MGSRNSGSFLGAGAGIPSLSNRISKGFRGEVLRDHHGAFLAGACHFFPSAADPEMAELLACHRAIRLAMEINVWKLFLETVFQSTVSKIKGKAKDFSVNGHLVNEIKSQLHSFQDFKVGWVRRCANSAAHSLAREGGMNKICKTWFHVPPAKDYSMVVLGGLQLRAWFNFPGRSALVLARTH